MAVEDVEMALLTLSGSEGSGRGGEVPGGGEMNSETEERQVTIYIHRSIAPLTIKLKIGGTLHHLNFADCTEEFLKPPFAESTELCRQYGSEFKDLSGREVKSFLTVLIPLCPC